MEVGIWISLGSLLIAFSGFLVGQLTQKKKDGKEQGAIEVRLQTIQATVTEIKEDVKNANLGAMKGAIDNNTRRIDVLEKNYNALITKG